MEGVEEGMGRKGVCGCEEGGMGIERKRVQNKELTV